MAQTSKPVAVDWAETAEELQARYRAERDADAVRIAARAEAEANRVRAESLTTTLVEYERIRRWNGQGPTTVIGGHAQPRIDVPVVGR